MALVMASAGSSSTLPTSTAARKNKKRTRLVEAVSHGNVEKIMKLLVSCDPNFMDESSGGETPLCLAAGNTSLQTTVTQRVIVALVNGGAILDFRNKEGRTALHVAVRKSNYVALKTLLSLGASPDFRDVNGLTPLFYTIIHKANPKLTQLLLHERSVIGCSDQQGWQEAHHASKLGLSGHLEHLLYYGADMNAKIAGSGNTPLHVAAINDQKDCAKLLLMRGCDTSIVNNSHQTAHQVAVIAGNLELAERIQNFKSEQVTPFREKPKYNPSSACRPTPASTASSSSSGHHLNYSKSLNNGPCCPSSPCLSQRSCATSTTFSSSTTSSGVCCELDHSSQTGSVSSEDDPRSQLTVITRIEGRREQKLGSSCTLPSRGRRGSGVVTQLSKQDSTGSNASSSGGSDSGCIGTPPITSYSEKTVSLIRGSKGFGFVLRGAKATSPAVRSLQSQQSTSSSSSTTSSCSAEKAVASVQPISLQYLDEIEEGGVAQVAGLKKGDFLLKVNGVDVAMAPHEQVVALIRNSGDKVIMSVASPIYLKLDPDEVEREKQQRKLIKDSVTNGEEVGADVPPADPLYSHLPKSGSQTLPSRGNGHAVPSSGSADQIVDHSGRSRSRAPPPVPPKRDPSTTLTIGRKSLSVSEAAACASAATSSSGQQQDGTTSTDVSSSGVDDTSYSTVSHHQVQENTTAVNGSIVPTGNCGLNNNKHDNYDSEGRSDKSSSSASTSIESMIPNANCAVKDDPNQSEAGTGAKIASIRSRGARRMSALELEQFFARQDDESLTSNPHRATHSKPGDHSCHTLKSKKMKSSNSSSKGNSSNNGCNSQKLGKDYHSVPDIQQELLQEEMQQQNGQQFKTLIDSSNGNQTDGPDNNKGRQLSNSQEDLKKVWIKCAVETVTLKNGKIVQQQNQTVDRVPAPSDPPPPPPPPPVSSMPSSCDPLPHPPAFLLLNKANVTPATATIAATAPVPASTSAPIANGIQRKASDGNYAQMNGGNPEETSLNKIESGQGMSSFKAPTTGLPSSCGVSTRNDSDVNSSIGDPVNQNPNQELMKAVKHPNKSMTVQTSVYTRQSTMDVMEERKSKPFIPEPDYSSEDETTGDTVVSMAPKDMSTFRSGNQQAVNSSVPKSDNERNDPVTEAKQGTCVGKIAPAVPPKSREAVAVAASLPTSFPPPILSAKEANDPVNKVQASIREFERRSSLTSNDSGSTNSTGTVSSSTMSTGSSSISMTTCVATSVASVVPSGSTTGTSLARTSQQQNPIPTVAAPKLQSNDSFSSNSSASSVNSHNNPPNLIRMSRSCYEVESCGSSGLDNGSSGISSDVDDYDGSGSTLNNSKVQTLNRKNSVTVFEKIANLFAQNSSQSKNQTPAAQTPPQQPLASSLKQQGSRTLEKRVSIADPPEQPPTGSSVRSSAPTKTWSEISSAVKTAKPAATSQVMVGNSVRPVSAPTATQLARSCKDAGLAGVNEVDVLAELVPPPPEFAALPGQQNVAGGQHKVQIQVKASDVPRLMELSEGSLVRIMNPATGQVHTIHKPIVKPAPSVAAASTPAVQMQHQMERKTGTPPTFESEWKGMDGSGIQQQQQQQRMSMSLHAGSGSQQQTAFRYLTPQQQAQIDYLQKQQQLSQQQFATLSRAYSGANQTARLVPLSAISGGHSHGLGVTAASASVRGSDNPGNRSPQMSRAQFAIVSSNSLQHVNHQPTYQLASQQGYQQFATLSRAGQKALAVATSQPGVQAAYGDLNRLTVQNRMIRQGQDTQVVQWTPQQLQQLTPQQRQALIQRYQLQQQQQQQAQQLYVLHPHPTQANIPHSHSGHSHVVHQHVAGKGHAPPVPPQAPVQPPPPGPPPSVTSGCISKPLPVSFPRKSMKEWSCEDVGDWLTSIGMGDHRKYFESLTGAKLLRLGDNDLATIGLRQDQHRNYVLEKIKQYVHYQQQHPPSAH